MPGLNLRPREAGICTGLFVDALVDAGHGGVSVEELAFMVAAPPNAIVCVWFRDLAEKGVRGRLVPKKRFSRLFWPKMFLIRLRLGAMVNSPIK